MIQGYFNDTGPVLVKQHYNDIVMDAMASEITTLTIVYLTVYSGVDQRKYQTSAPLAFMGGIHRSPMNFPHKWLVTRKMFPFDDVIMNPKYYRQMIHINPLQSHKIITTNKS